MRDEGYYARVLELNGHVSPVTVKQRYRDLVAQYHPDKVQHLGVDLQRTAERKTKEINEAYEYFSRKFGF